MNTAFPITTASTVDDAVARSSSAIAVFHDLGIDTCCGGGATLAEAAASSGVDLITLLATLATEAERDGGLSRPAAPSCGCRIG